MNSRMLARLLHHITLVIDRLAFSHIILVNLEQFCRFAAQNLVETLCELFVTKMPISIFIKLVEYLPKLFVVHFRVEGDSR